MIPRLIAILSPGVIRVELHRWGRIRWAAEAEWASADDLGEVLAQLAGEGGVPSFIRGLEVRLAPELFQSRRLEGLPRVGGRALRQMVELTPQRFFRRNGVPLVVDVRWENARSRTAAIGAAIPLPLAEAIVRGARDAGLVVEQIAPHLPGPPGHLRLLPAAEKARQSANALAWTRRAVIAACFTWTLLAAAVVVRIGLERRRVDARLAELRGPLDALLASKAAADSASAIVAQLESDAASEGAAVTTLLRIAAAMPDSAFLTQIRIDSAGVGLVAGAARRPAAVLASLEREGGLRVPRFAGRTTPDLVGGRPVERFAIDFGGEERHP